MNAKEAQRQRHTHTYTYRSNRRLCFSSNKGCLSRGVAAWGWSIVGPWMREAGGQGKGLSNQDRRRPWERRSGGMRRLLLLVLVVLPVYVGAWVGFQGNGVGQGVVMMLSVGAYVFHSRSMRPSWISRAHACPSSPCAPVHPAQAHPTQHDDATYSLCAPVASIPPSIRPLPFPTHPLPTPTAIGCSTSPRRRPRPRPPLAC